MTLVQSDFYQQWALFRITDSSDANYAFDEKIEYLALDTVGAGGSITVTLPEIDGTLVTDGKRIWIADNGNASTNNVIVQTNASDSSTIDGNSTITLSRDNFRITFEVVAGTWVILANTEASALQKSLGAFYMNGNVTSTIISAINTYTQIAGTATAFPENNNFSFAAAPNTLEYDGANPIDAMVVIDYSVVRESGSATREARLALFKNGTEVTGVNSGIAVSGVNRGGAITGPISIVTSDDLEVRIRNEQSTDNIIVVDLNLVVHEL